MSTQTLQPPAPREKARTPAARRPTLPAAHGEPMIWVMGAGLVLALMMIVAMFVLIVAQGSETFWPRPIDRVSLKSGEVFFGVPAKEDPDQGRREYRVGNRDVTGASFRWVALKDIATIDRPPSAVMLERTAWGVWLGEPKAVVVQDELLLSREEGAAPAPATASTEHGSGRVERTVVGEQDGKVKVRQRVYLAEGAGGAELLDRMQPRARERAAQVERMTERDLGDINHEIEATRLATRRAEIAQERAADARPPMLNWGAVTAVCVGAVLALGIAWRWRGDGASATGKAVRAGSRGLLVSAAMAALLLAALEHPRLGDAMTAERVQSVRQANEAHIADLQKRYGEIQAQIAEVRREDERVRAIVAQPDGQFAPIRQSTPDEPMLVSQIVRIVPANALSWSGKVGVYLSRWWEFLSDDPREANTEGGVFPVIFGTVTLTLLLSIVVVPLGVIAALYLREYARQGPLVSLIRISVNNLAGIPSIVYGVFGYGFFLSKVGAFIDQGPATPAPAVRWWWAFAVMALLVGMATGLATLAKGMMTSHRRGQVRMLMGLAWLGAAGLVVWAIAGTPYFSGFFREKLPSPTYGTRGILWASLTLALLTLPVVIVATEEAIAAVPRSVREGSYGCGASKWQTVRRIVLPQALPGIMTGGILAMARGAGEVAPLMLVGAMKLAPELPVDGRFPYVHPERSFMHLGFHIYDLGFQSPDSEAARPLLWTTTLLLVAIVLVLNLSAVIVRARLRSGAVSSGV